MSLPKLELWNGLVVAVLQPPTQGPFSSQGMAHAAADFEAAVKLDLHGCTCDLLQVQTAGGVDGGRPAAAITGPFQWPGPWQRCALRQQRVGLGISPVCA